jgi:Subtilase family
MDLKYYQLGTHTEAGWDSLHQELCHHNSDCDHVPARSVECVDEQLHSATRGTYLLTDAEADTLKLDPRIKFLNIDYKQYPKEYKAPADELHSVAPPLVNRYATTVKNYREFSASNTLAGTTADANRTGYQLHRCQQKLDPWVDNAYTDNFVVNTNISQYGTGKHIDVIVADDGTWFGHPEFQNNSILTSNSAVIERPSGYVGGNQLPGNGTCDLLDLVLDAPYYIDPEWFDADPSNRLVTRWDGTRVPVENIARAWWTTSSQRSSQFVNAGTVFIDATYTRANCNGTNIAQSTVGDHGTACAGLTYGRTQGWAYNSNKWAFNLYNTYGTDIEQGFDLVKIFHQTKPVNPEFNTKNPTVMSNSWGYRANKDPLGVTYYYTHRSTTNVAYTSETGINWLSHMGTQGDAGRWKSEMKVNSYTTALDELIASGVIFVAAAGNSNQKQVNSDHPDYNNYITTSNAGTLQNSSFTEFGLTVTGTTNRRGFPQQGGMYTESDVRIYPVINIGALDDDYKTSKEAKVSYSDRGNSIDVYAPADGTLAANRGYGSSWNRVDTYPQYRQGSGASVDTGFSAACSTSVILSGGTFLPSAGSSFSFVTSSGQAIITSITPNLQNITSNSVTTPTSGSNDDGFYTVALPWSILYNGTSRSTVFVGTNTYITFGSGSAEYANLSGSNPNLDKIFVSSTDNSVQRIYTDTQGVSPNRLFVIRMQGRNSTSGTLGSPNMEWEWHFSENTPNRIDLHIVSNARITTQGITAPLTATDTAFSGTSAACPVAAGFIATMMEHNRDWTWQDVKAWLRTLDVQDPSDFYYGTESTTVNTANWLDYESLEGSDARVLYQGKVNARFKTGSRPVLSGGGRITANFRYRK